MTSPYGTARKCAELTSRELEKTFFYPGPHDVRKKPGAPAVRHWEQAKEVCIECPAFLSCRQERLGEEYGVWGGTDQYERYKARQVLQRQLRQMDRAHRQALADMIVARASGPLGERPQVIARKTGYSVTVVNAFLAEHEKAQEAVRAQREAAKTAALDAIGAMRRPVWPVRDPTEGHAWVFRDGDISPGYYIAETRDGRWMRMKLRTERRSPVIRWFLAMHVDLRMEVAPNYEIWTGGKANGAKRSHHRSPAAA